MTTLVTGGAGYIGSHSVRALQSHGTDVVALGSLERGRADSIDAPLVVGNTTDTDLECPPDSGYLLWGGRGPSRKEF